MDFKVYVIIEAPIIDQEYELFVPIDRKINDLLDALKKSKNDFSVNYYKNNSPNIYNKTTGKIYNLNAVIKNTDIKMGTRLVII